MRAVTFEWGKRGPKTALSQVFLQETGAKNLDELVEGLYTHKYNIKGSLVMQVFQTAAGGDQEAINVIRWAGDQLGQMACGIIRQLELENEPVEVVLIGSVFNGHPLMTQSLSETVHAVAHLAQLLRLKAPPVVGGVLLGMEQVMGPQAYETRENLLTFTSEPKLKNSLQTTESETQETT